MTDLQKRFAEEYVIDYKITAAGKRAGIQGDNINITAWQMLQLEDVQEYVEQLQSEATKRCSISQDEILYELKNVGMSNIQDYMDDNLEVKSLSEIPKEKAKAIKSIKKTVTEFDGGSKTVVEFVLHDKLSGLDKLGRHIGLYNKDESNKSAITLVFDKQDEQIGSDVPKD
jgi:phage terminase small subunit